MACKLKAMGWVDWLHWWVRWSTASHIRHSRRATWTLVGATRVPLWSHLAADVSLGNRRRQCFRGQRQLLWYADSTPCWSQDHSLPSALTLNDAVAYPARTPNLASGSAIKRPNCPGHHRIDLGPSGLVSGREYPWLKICKGGINLAMLGFDI